MPVRKLVCEAYQPTSRSAAVQSFWMRFGPAHRPEKKQSLT